MASILIGEDGNPIYHKRNWRSYAIYRLEHWGLRYINNVEVTDEDIFEANQVYHPLFPVVKPTPISLFFPRLMAAWVSLP